MSSDVYISVFTGNLQRSTVVKHNEAKEHKQALEAHHMRRQLYGTNIDSNAEEETPPQPTSVSASEKHLFRTVHYCALEHLPNSMVNSQLEFLKASGVDPQVTDIHHESVKDVQQSLLYVLDEQLRQRLREGKYYGIIVDESTDLSIHKKLVVYIRYVADGEITTDLVGNIRIPDGCANTITEEILKEIKCLGLDAVNLVGLGSDGASVMFGRKAGVGVKLEKDAPYLLHVHCVAHRLALACADSAKDIPYLKKYRETLKNLYVHVTGSGIRSHKLEALQAVMDEPQLKVKDPISIRWLAMEGAVKTVHMCYGSIVTYLESNDGKNTVGDNVANGLLKEMLHYKFPAFTAVLSDVLGVIGVLCRQLQSDSLDLSQFTPMKESTLGRLNGLKTVDGECTETFKEAVTTTGSKIYYKGIQLTHANEKTQVEALRVSYIETVVHHVDERLSTESSPVLEAFSVYEPKAASLDEEVVTNDKLKTLSDKYQVDSQKLQLEYCGVKALMTGSYKNMSFQDFSKLLITRHKSEYPLTSQICAIGLCVPVTSVACERGFSLQNRIKVKSRTSLSPENLETLMRIAKGPGMDSFPYELAIGHWRREKRRRLARLYQPKK